MNQPLKTTHSVQRELFETHDIAWHMLTDEQRRQAAELLSKLFLDVLRAEQTVLEQQQYQQPALEKQQ